MKYCFILFFAVTLPLSSQDFSKSIEDNSYYIEEAYNQEDRIVQHIFNGNSFTPGNLLESSFTQEWPAFGRLHQISFTLPFQYSTATNPSTNGIGDVFINYRYQLMDEQGLAVSPRISIIFPTGDNAKGFGNGVVGAQINLPVSKRFSNEFILHGNLGGTLYPNVDFSGSKASISEYFIGASGIYLTRSSFNVMTEILYTSSGSTLGRTNELIVSPGLRYAIDINDLQIVPGIAFPFSFASGTQSNGYFLYLSFEHPY